MSRRPQTVKQKVARLEDQIETLQFRIGYAVMPKAKRQLKRELKRKQRGLKNLKKKARKGGSDG